ncbi:MAG: hypothetical protein HY319_21615 [Armatimonadetes bacterium]|nr:hypothetical protein [Armatimonadota bacterium]
MIIQRTLAILVTLLCVGSAWAQSEADPAAFYLKFHDVLQKAQRLDEIRPYFTEQVLQEWSEEEVEDAEGLNQLRRLVPRELELVSQAIDGKTATLTWRGAIKDPDNGEVLQSTGIVSLVQVGGQWRIDNATWGTGAQ